MIGPRPRRPRRPPFDWSSTRAVLMIGPEPAGSERLPATHPGVSNALIRRVGANRRAGSPPIGAPEPGGCATGKGAFGYNKVIQ